MKTSLIRSAAPFVLALAVSLAGCSPAVVVDDRPEAVQPGAPGEATRAVPAEAAITRPAHTEADVRFMEHMIVHHAQAVEMTELVPERTEHPGVRRLAQRIEAAQEDEIVQMRRWLAARGEPVPPLHDPIDHAQHGHACHAGEHGCHAGEHGCHAGEHGESCPHHDGHDHDGHECPCPRHAEHDAHRQQHHDPHAGMPGMLTREQLDQLAAATGDTFDRLFLEFMILHHEGALAMVEELFASDGGQETEIFQFASHVDSDQRIEIQRMRRMLNDLPNQE